MNRKRTSGENVFFKRSSKNIWEASNVAKRWGCWADQTGTSIIKKYVGGFNQSKTHQELITKEQFWLMLFWCSLERSQVVMSSEKIWNVIRLIIKGSFDYHKCTAIIVPPIHSLFQPCDISDNQVSKREKYKLCSFNVGSLTQSETAEWRPRLINKYNLVCYSLGAKKMMLPDSHLWNSLDIPGINELVQVV